MPSDRVQRRLAAIVAADMVGYSRLMQADETGTIARQKSHRAELIDPKIAEYGGRIVKTTGDGLLIEFASAVDAVECVVDIQKAMTAREADVPEERRITYRMGVNIGDIVIDGDDILGDGVNVAARLEALAEAGGIVVSRPVRNQVRDKLDFAFGDMGEIEVKNIARPVRVFRVLPDGAARYTPKSAARNVASKRLWLAAAAMLTFVIGAGGGTAWWLSQPDFEPANPAKMAYALPEKPSVAVLPFDNLSGDPDKDFLADSFSENIIAVLSTVPELFVIARNSVFTYKGKAIKVQEVAEQLGVRYVLEGSVQQQGEKLRVTAQLVDAIDGKHLWSKRFDRNLKDLTELFAIQDEIALGIVEEMHVNLTYGESAGRYMQGIHDVETLRKIAEAGEVFQTWSPAGNQKAEKLYGAVLEKQPESLFGNTMMAWVYLQKVLLEISKDPKQDLSTSREYAEKALAIENGFANAHTVLAALDLFARDHVSAIAHVDRAVELDPNGFYPAGAWVKLHSGQPGEAAAYLERLMRLQPHHFEWMPAVLADSLVRLGEHDKAKAIYEELLASPKKDLAIHPWSLRGLTAISVFEGELDRARGYMERLLEIDPNSSASETRRRLFYEKDQAFLDLYLDALRQAGLPDNPPRSLPDKPSIAVLPFDNLSDDPEQEYFADGMTDDLITDLSRISDLLVIARNSVFTYKGKNAKVQDIARDLNVKYVLEGSVRHADGQVRINAQLIDAGSGGHLWAETFDRPFTNIFALQDEVTGQIVRALKLTLNPVDQERLSDVPTRDLAAYDIYLRARKAHFQFGFDGTGLKEALELYAEATARDPSFADAHAGYADVAAYVWHHGPPWVLGGDEARQRAEEAIANALTLAPDNAAALRVRSEIQRLEGSLDEAIATLRSAVASNPNDAATQRALAWSLAVAGRTDEALLRNEIALRLDPRPHIQDAQTTGLVFFAGKRYEDAVKFFADVATRAPKAWNGHTGLSVSYAQLGNIEEAKAAAAISLRLWPAFNRQFIKIWTRHWNKELRERWLVGLRKAGVPEWPYGFKGNDEDRLTGTELKELMLGRRLSGNVRDMGSFELEIADNGHFEYRSELFNSSGKYRVKEDMICAINPNFTMGREYCYPIYRNPTGTRAKSDQFVGTSPTGLYWFSAVD